MSYTQAQATKILRGFGFRIRSTAEYRQVVTTFQAGYNLGTWLTVDGACGPKTSAAIARSRAVGRASAHFAWSEFRCTCGGRYSNCRRILVQRELLQSLEKYRAKVGHPIRFVSAYRCPGRNAEVGGARNSQHMYGGAVDLSDQVSRTTVLSLRAFAGIGRDRRSSHVEHVDRRDKAGHNLTRGTTTNPTEWTYH